MPNEKRHYDLKSISEVHRIMGLPKPLHPLISLIPLHGMQGGDEDVRIVFHYYTISFKKNVQGKIRYGQQYYDFDEGIMTCIAPNQIMNIERTVEEYSVEGWMLIFHPDFIRNYPLGTKIKNYGFFSYDTNEALHLSDQEEEMLLDIMKNIEREYRSGIDQFSQDVMVSHLEVLLNYINRFYNRQFLTRKPAHTDLMARLSEVLDGYINSKEPLTKGLPTVIYVAEKLNVSPSYLSDMLKTEAGITVQQYIHNKVIDKAKDSLAISIISIGEIAYELGFQHTQSFSKFFKAKTGQTPLMYRQSLN